MSNVKPERLEFDPRLSPAPAHSLSACPSRTPWLLPDKSPRLGHEGGGFPQTTGMLGSPTSPYRNWAPPATHGVYSLFPSTDTVYQPSARYHHTLSHPKESLFTLTSPPVFHSPVQQPAILPQPSPGAGGIAQLELMAKGFNGKRFDDAPAKRRWEAPDVAVKTENGGRSCGCRHSPSPSRLILPRTTEAAAFNATGFAGDFGAAKKSENSMNSGCSRTNPVTLRVAPTPAPNIGIVNDLLDVHAWTGAGIVIKKEPGGGVGTPCQVPEVTTSVAAAPCTVKVEEGCRKDAGIPVGIAVARQRTQQQDTKVALCSGSNGQQDLQQAAISTMALLQPQCEDRLTNGLSPWAGTTSLTPPTSTLWQYPGLGVEPMAPVGYQLIRDPMTGHFLLIPAASVLWPTYQQPAQQEPIGYERILVQQAQPQIQQVQQQLRPSVEVKSRPLRVKEEKMRESSPTPQHFMMHPEPMPLSLDSGKRSQATSPVSCVTPPCDINNSQSESEDCVAPPPAVTVQDASNQTDAPSISEDETFPPCLDTSTSVQTNGDFPCHNASIGVGTDAPDDKSSEYLPSNDCDSEVRLPTEEENQIADVAEANVSCDVVASVIPLSSENEPTTTIPIVDLSGLELLSNSIEQFERVKECVKESPDSNIPDDAEISEEKAAETLQLLSRRKERVRSEFECSKETSVGPGNMSGLGLLCALAEQRFMEEVSLNNVNAEVERFTAKEPDLSDVNRNYKTRKSERDCRKFIASKVQQYYASGPNSPVAFSTGCVSPPPGELMDAMELNMRMRLAELQRKYREKQKELSKLTPKKYDPDSASSPTKRGPGRPRKKCGKFHLDSPPESPKTKPQRRESQPPVLEKIIDTRWTSETATKPKSTKLDILKPPTLTANKILTSAKFKPEMKTNGATNGKGLKLTTNGSPAKLGDVAKKESDKTEKLKIKTECTDKKSAFPCSRANHTFGSKPPARLPRPGENESMFWFKSTQDPPAPKPEDKPPTPSPPAPFSSSKKRKVGRPKKHLTSTSISTETIVAKKPKSKSSLVGFLLNKSRRLSSSDVPSTFKSANAYARPLSMVNTYTPAGYKSGANSVEVFPGTENVFAAGEKKKPKEEVKSHKILPKLKAEAKMKTWTCGDEDDVIDWMHAKKEETSTPTPKPIGPQKRKSSVISLKPDAQASKPKIAKKSPASVSAPAVSPPPKPPKISPAPSKPTPPAKTNGATTTPGEPTNKKRVKRSESASSANQSPGTSESDDVPLIVFSKKSGCRCLLTEVHLETERLRALALMNGLFYAGELSPIQPPDVYGIKLDGERGNKPHILTREEVLKDAILEVRAGSLLELPPGTRVCAYWSQQYRALYPGTVAPNEAGDAHTSLVSVEFDDGDNGKIGVDDIRLLPEDYPIVEYDPNPLLTLGRRRRQASGASCESHSRRASADIAHANNNNNNNIVSKPPAKQEEAQEAIAREEERGEEGEVTGDERASKEQRKRLKKRRRDKLKRLNSLPADVVKRRKKKHRCCDEHCRHRRHHRRHRKHKHRHSRGGKDSDKVDSDAMSRLSPVLEQLDILEIQQTAIRQLTNENKLKEEEERKKKKEEEEEEEAEEEEEEEDEEVTSPAKKSKKESVKAAAAKKVRDRQPSVESRSKMAAFLPARQLWGWAGRGFKRPGARGRGKKEFFKSIQRGKETIMVGDCAVFLSTGRPDRPYIGRIESMWESWGTNMVVKVKWFYHPEETTGCPAKLKYPGALFESPHVDENDVQTISHKCEVMELAAYATRMGSEPDRLATIYDNNDVYYQAGYYDPTTSVLTVVKGVV